MHTHVYPSAQERFMELLMRINFIYVLRWCRLSFAVQNLAPYTQLFPWNSSAGPCPYLFYYHSGGTWFVLGNMLDGYFLGTKRGSVDNHMIANEIARLILSLRLAYSTVLYVYVQSCIIIKAFRNPAHNNNRQIRLGNPCNSNRI